MGSAGVHHSRRSEWAVFRPCEHVTNGLAMEGKITGAHVDESRGNLTVGLRDGVKRYPRVGVMNPVVGHIPHQPSNNRIADDGAGASELVAPMAKPGVFCHEVEAKDDVGNGPSEERGAKTGDHSEAN